MGFYPPPPPRKTHITFPKSDHQGNAILCGDHTIGIHHRESGWAIAGLIDLDEPLFPYDQRVTFKWESTTSQCSFIYETIKYGQVMQNLDTAQIDWWLKCSLWHQQFLNHLTGLAESVSGREWVMTSNTWSLTALRATVTENVYQSVSTPSSSHSTRHLHTFPQRRCTEWVLNNGS